MALDAQGALVEFVSSKEVSWRDVLTPQRGSYRVGATIDRADGSKANVIFAPEGGLAHVYVANETEVGDAAWTRPPSLETLRPLVNNIFRATRTTEPGSVSDILIRVPDDPLNPTFGTYETPSSRYKVLARDYKPAECGANGDEPCEWTCGMNGNEGCTLEAQLLDLGTMTEAPFTSADPIFNYSDPAARVGQWISENTGDIVLLANLEGGYYFDAGKKASQHGSLTYADSIVPLAFSYPGATDELLTVDNVLASVAAYLETVAPKNRPAPSPVEEFALECALGGKLRQPQPDHCAGQ